MKHVKNRTLRFPFFKLFFCLLILHSTISQAEDRTRVVLSTNKGDITLVLYNETPIHRDNFIKLCQTHFYDSLLFHRVIENFMIQGGDPHSRHAIASKPLGDGGPGYDLPAEIIYPRFYHHRGVIAASRIGDELNPERLSNGSQFYIVWGKRFSKSEIRKIAEDLEQSSGGKIVMPDSVKAVYTKVGGSPHLDGQYTIFGEVTEGLNVVNRIQKSPTLDNDRPFDDVVILSTQIIKPSQP